MLRTVVDLSLDARLAMTATAARPLGGAAKEKITANLRTVSSTMDQDVTQTTFPQEEAHSRLTDLLKADSLWVEKVSAHASCQELCPSLTMMAHGSTLMPF